VENRLKKCGKPGTFSSQIATFVKIFWKRLILPRDRQGS